MKKVPERVTDESARERASGAETGSGETVSTVTSFKILV